MPPVFNLNWVTDTRSYSRPSDVRLRDFAAMLILADASKMPVATTGTSSPIAGELTTDARAVGLWTGCWAKSDRSAIVGTP